MALPVVLSLVDALLALGAVLVGSSVLDRRHERPEAARVVAAAQRGAVDLLSQAAPFGALFLVLFLAGGLLTRGAPQSLALAGLLGAGTIAAGAWLAGWQVSRRAARLSRPLPAERIAVELGRLSTATLLLGGAAGGALTATCFAWFPEAPVQAALTAVAAAVGLASVLARPGVLSWAAAGRGHAPTGLHPGSLAELVGGAFTSSWLLYTSLFALSALGQVALFSLTSSAPHGLGTYALLLPRIGLFALACGGLGSRTSSRDPAHSLWQRELAISLVVLGGGAWAARGVLGSDAARAWAPVLVSYLCAAFGFGAWLLGSRQKQESSFATWLALLPVLVLSVVAHPAELGGASAVLLLALASALALLPHAATYRLGASALASASACELLATGISDLEGGREGSRLGPSAGQRGLFLPVGLVVALCATLSILLGKGAETTNPLALGFGALGSALLLLGLARRQEAIGDEGGARLAELCDKRPLDGGLLLAEGLTMLKRVGTQQQLAFALWLALPPLLLLGLAWGGVVEARALAAGSLVGALIWAAVSERPADDGRPHPAHSNFVWPLALYHLGWAALLVASFP